MDIRKVLDELIRLSDNQPANFDGWRNQGRISKVCTRVWEGDYSGAKLYLKQIEDMAISKQIAEIIKNHQ